VPEHEDYDLSQANRTEFVNAVAHLYRGALNDASAWRTRIDTTSNWAIVMSASALTFVFADKAADRHNLILIIGLFCTGLLLIEARRYRTFDIWRSRARILERCFYRPMLDGCPPDPPDWRQRLSEDLRWPEPHIPMWEAIGRRLRRNYQYIYAVLLASWLVKLMSHPTATTSVQEVISRAAVGPIPGQVVFILVGLFYAGLIALGLYSFWASRIKKSLPAGHPLRMPSGHHIDG
jgi:uncharacterized membrane protein